MVNFISADCNFSWGISQQFENRYKIKSLISQNDAFEVLFCVGGCVALEVSRKDKPPITIFNLVTRKRLIDKSDKLGLELSLNYLNMEILDRGIKKIAFPQVCHGMLWFDVLSSIKSCLSHSIYDPASELLDTLEVICCYI